MQARHRIKINVTLPPHLIAEADKMAKALLTSRSAVIEAALRSHLPTQPLTIADKARFKFKGRWVQPVSK